MVLVLETRSSSTSTARADYEYEYEYEKPSIWVKKTQILTHHQHALLVLQPIDHFDKIIVNLSDDVFRSG